MSGFTTSQWIEIVVIVFSLVLYFCGITYAEQNGWIFIFSIALLCLICGRYVSTQTCFS